MSDTQLVEHMRSTAERIELQSIDFINDAGQYSRNYTQIRMIFIDGTTILLPRRLEESFNRQVFTLRPKRDHA